MRLKQCWYCELQLDLDKDKHYLVPMKGIHFIFCPECYFKKKGV